MRNITGFVSIHLGFYKNIGNTFVVIYEEHVSKHGVYLEGMNLSECLPLVSSKQKKKKKLSPYI